MMKSRFFSKRCLGTISATLLLLTVVVGTMAQDALLSLPGDQPVKSVSEAGAKRASLETFMKEFKKVYSNIYYSYQSSTLKEVPVSYAELNAAKESNPDIVLQGVLVPAGLSFEKIKEVYVIRREGNISRTEDNYMVEAVQRTVLADFSVRGTVTDANGGVPGVTVSERGTTNATTTDGDGNFSLNVANSSAVLVFSSIGYKTQEVAIGGRNSVSVFLEADAQELESVVVTALGLTRDKKSLGYSIGTVKGDDMTHVANENMLTSMAGRVSGVTINQTSGVGSSISVIIRGASSLINNQPLYVIDGVPMGSSLRNVSEKGSNNRVDYGNAISDINPDDIESISVLKGPSAAALYGSRAGNGVILITTKSGKKGKGFGVSFSTSNVFETPYRYLDLHYKYANGVRPNQLDPTSAYWGGYPLDQGNKAVQWDSPLDANGMPVASDLVSYKDNMKNFLNTGITSTNNISVGGSTEKMSYRLSYNNMNNKGLIPGQDLYRNNISLAGSYEITKNLSVNTNINWVRSNSNSRPLTSERNANPLEAIYDAPYVDMTKFKSIWKPGLEGIEQLKHATNKNNAYFLAQGIQNAFVRDRFYGNVKFDWKISDAFSAFVRGTFNTTNEYRDTKIPWSYTSLPRGGYYVENLFGQEVNTDFLISYKKKVSDLDISVSAGGNYMQANWQNQNMGGRDLAVPNLYRMNNVARATLAYDNTRARKNIYSLYAMASVGFKDQVYLDLTGRNDWSSTLPASSRSYFYPSASLSWLAHTTLNLPSNVSLLKLRGGWAQTGNDTDPYSLYPALSMGSWGSLITSGMPGGLSNPNLKPEIATSIEGGIDFAMYNNRLRFDITYYDLNNRNQIFSVAMPASAGYTSKIVNAGRLNSKGWEVGIGGTPIKNKDWSWDLHANFTRNRVYIKELIDGMEFFSFWGEASAGAYTFVGEEVGDLYSRGYLQVTDPNSPYYRWPIIEWDGASGGMQWQELPGGNGNPNNEKVGNYNPRFLMGLQSTLTWKRWALGLSFDWRNGGNFMSFTYRYGESDWKSQRQLDNLIPGGSYTKAELVALLKSNPEKYIIPQNGNFPRVGGHTQQTGGFALTDGGTTLYDGVFIPGVWQDAAGNYHEWLGGDGTQYIPITDAYPWSFNKQVTFDASFIKLREITLSYRIPNLFGVTRNATFSVYSRNLMLWNAAKIGIDPERAYWADPGAAGGGGFRQGIERQNVMPWTIPFGFKLNVDF
ncbi:MAG: SusC/RagA family TonB-linked outer membrane protein [Chitinophagaceae bacterium]|nr:SusC/RagA family TonB-linked outer membrane protein [Chitinophagaceae bacterium]